MDQPDIFAALVNAVYGATLVTAAVGLTMFLLWAWRNWRGPRW
jgi:hypothetical protein